MNASGHNSAIEMIRDRFLTRLADQYEQSRDLTQTWSKEKQDTESLEEFCAIAHKIAGLAKTIGFSDLGSAAFEADSTIQKWLGDDDSATSEADVTAAISGFMEACGHVLNGENRNGCDGS